MQYRRCVICNKPFVAKVTRQICCGEECSKIRRNQTMREYNKSANVVEKPRKKRKKHGMSGLAQINAEARAVGMTYGQYVGIMGL